MMRRRVVSTSSPTSLPGIADDGEEEDELEASELSARSPTKRHRFASTGDGDTEEDAAREYHAHRRRKTRSALEEAHFRIMNERVVQDITVEELYKPHTITILIVICAFLIYKAFQTGNVETTDRNVYDGLLGTLALFLVVAAMAFPNGPFIRPHPVLWRIIFGLSVVYMLVLQFALFQNFQDLKRVLTWLDPVGLSKEKLDEKEYAVNCSDLTLERFWSHLDIFAVGHYLGWMMKAVLIRHNIMCWYISICWELTEVVFTHLLPNFQECWWDAVLLDIILCNGLGIWSGLLLCRLLEMREYHWESIKSIKTARGKVRRVVMQFTPESWIRVDWGTKQSIRRVIALYFFVMIWLTSELNTFFLKHIFAIDTSHPVVFWRIILIGLISAPTIRQYYLYATDPLLKRVGMQCWVYLSICALEAAVCVKFGRDQFPPMKLAMLTAWVLFLVVGTFGAIWVSVWWARRSSSTTTDMTSPDGHKHRRYLDSSYENLGLIQDDVTARRKKLGIYESDYQTDT